jgi:hypothetical protein
MFMKRRRTIVLLAILALILLLAAAFFIYVSDYYRADAVAIAAFEQDETLLEKGNLIVLPAADPSDTALVFYPGGKVEAIAYLPILDKIRDNCGISCILVKMPFNLAVFNANAADRIYGQFPNIENWYIGGHSLGGAMASNYAAKHQNQIQGLILLGAYIYGEFPANKALTLYGTFNTSVAEKINYTENVVVIEGGNHAQFGNYGKQGGDPDATITQAEQQDIAVTAIKEFLQTQNP